MKQSFYSVIRYLDVDANHAVLAGRCIKILHGFLTANGYRNIGVTFPKWSIDTVGNCIAFVSQNGGSLEELVSQSPFKIMIEHDIIHTSEIFPVSESAVKIRFTRSQRIGKQFPGNIRRRYKRRRLRAIDRGEVFKEKLPQEAEEIEHFHAIPMSSHENNNKFMLFVQRQENFDQRGECKEFSSYGLANIKNHSAYVPELVDWL